MDAFQFVILLRISIVSTYVSILFFAWTNIINVRISVIFAWTKIIKILLLCLVLMQEKRKIILGDKLTSLQTILQMLQWKDL